MLKKTLAFIFALTATVSVLVSCTNTANADVSSSSGSSNNSVSDTANFQVSDYSSSPNDTSDTSSDDINTVVAGNFETIASVFMYGTYGYEKIEEDIIKEFPDEVNAIIALGEKAFSALDDIISTRDELDPRRAFANYLKYKIKPELYDRVHKSPDGKYSVICSVYTLLPTKDYSMLYGEAALIDNGSKSTLTLDGIKDNEIIVNWSPDSNYAAVSYDVKGSDLITTVFDVKNSKIIKLPEIAEIEEKFSLKSSSGYDGTYFSFNEWLSDSKVKIDIYAIAPTGSEDAYRGGWYIYDLKNGKITDGKFELVGPPATDEY